MFCVDFLEGNMDRLFTWGICETAALENYSQKCLNKNQREELLHYFDVRRRQKYISEAEYKRHLVWFFDAAYGASKAEDINFTERFWRF